MAVTTIGVIAVFNPIFNQTFEFQAKSFDLGFIQFTAKDYSSSEKLGETVLPLVGMNEGYRHVNLKDETGNEIKNSTIFVKIERITDFDHVTMKRLSNIANQ